MNMMNSLDNWPIVFFTYSFFSTFKKKNVVIKYETKKWETFSLLYKITYKSQFWFIFKERLLLLV